MFVAVPQEEHKSGRHLMHPGEEWGGRKMKGDQGRQLGQHCCHHFLNFLGKVLQRELLDRVEGFKEERKLQLLVKGHSP